jgi:PAS domain S-box-containing protein
MELEVKQDLLDKRLFMNMVQNNWLAVMFANMNNIVEYVNPAACELYGYEEHELIGQTTAIFNSTLSKNTDDILKSIADQGYWFGEIIQKKKDHTTFHSLLSVQLILNEEGHPIGFASNSKDISIELESERTLKKIIAEKELLLKELHHRVKNNLAIIKGIISLQDHDSLDVNGQQLVADFKNRIDAVATLHNTLYDSENLTHLNFKPFIHDLSDGLNRSYAVNGKEITIRTEIDDYSVDISKATPLCLILNEVLTNSFKHAFNQSNKGSLSITLTKKTHTITISDNGPGFNLKEIKSSSLGISLINDLAEQIDATFNYDNNNGTQFSIQLK